MIQLTVEDRERIRAEACKRSNEMAAAARKLSRADALDFMLSPRGQFVTAYALSLAICAHDRLPRHRRAPPSDMKDVATLLWSLFPVIAGLEMQQVLEQAAVDGLLEAPEDR